MKVVILAGGFGTRLSEETDLIPKPMVEIGGRPILWHIMKHYSYYGHNNFYVALGYKGEVIKRYFMDYFAISSDMRIELGEGKVHILNGNSETWRINLIDTGSRTNTGGRIKRLEKWLADGPFAVTYGDGVSDVDLGELQEFHKKNKKIATVTAVRPPARFGGMEIEGDLVRSFEEKSQIRTGWINGGYFIFEPDVLSLIDGDDTILEADTLPRLAKEGNLAAFQHDKFWQCMDTLRDKRHLEHLWNQDAPPWRIWE